MALRQQAPRSPLRLFIDPPSTDFQHSAAPESLVGQEFALSADQSHYLRDVRRLGEGAPLTIVVRGIPSPFGARITDTADLLRVRLVAVEACRPGSAPVQTLCIALTKGSTSDLIVEKATELCVPRIVFWQSDRSVVKIGSDEDREKRLARWERVATAAGQQSGQDQLPEIYLFASTEHFLAMFQALSESDDMRLYCSLGPAAVPLNSVLTPASPPVHLLIGPEGDISEREAPLLHSAGFREVTLGPARLRAETAAIAAAAMVQGIVGFAGRG